MTKETEIIKVIEKLRLLDDEQLMYIVGATNAFCLSQKKEKKKKSEKKDIS